MEFKNWLESTPYKHIHLITEVPLTIEQLPISEKFQN
jgi:hypothetical protein